MKNFRQDVRHGLRLYARTPGFTFVVIFTLALGIGANAAMFGVVNAVLLKPLPYPDPERLVFIGETEPSDPGSTTCSHRNFVDVRAQAKTFEAMAVYYSRSFTLTGGAEAARLRGVVASHDLFRVLGVSPILGRALGPDDDKPGGGGAGYPVLLGFNCWKTRFGGDEQIVGRSVTLNGRAHTVVGVLPDGFTFPISPLAFDLWTSTALDAEATGQGTIMVARGYRTWNGIGRLRLDATLERARAELDLIAGQLAAQYPDDNSKMGLRAVPLAEWLTGDVRLMLLVLSGAVGCVLLVVCVNVANLLLTKATGRGRELAIRAAIGAGRGRLVRQLLTESLMLASIGGTVGIFLSAWGIDALVRLGPDTIPRLKDATLDGRVLGFSLLVTLTTGVLFGCAPAFSFSPNGLIESLKAGGSGVSEDGIRKRFRSVLVACEIALSVMLLVGAGLLVNSFVRLLNVDPGFDPKNVIAFNVDLSGNRYADSNKTVEFYRRLTEGLRTLPGVVNAAAVSSLPLSGSDPACGFDIEGRPTDPSNEPFAGIRSATPGYFAAMGIRLVKGRDFTERDTPKSPYVLIVNEALARRYFPNEEVLGKRLRPSFSINRDSEIPLEVVGVVKDVKHAGLAGEASPEIYFPHAQTPMASLTVAVRSTGDLRALIPAFREQVRALDPQAPVYRVLTLDEYVSRSVVEQRFITLAAGVFAVLALILAAVGLYGTVAHGVAARTREIGIRTALGAQRTDLLKLIIGQGMTPALIGLPLGLIGSFGIAQTLSSFLFGVTVADPATFGGVAALLAGVSLVACWIPAHRATKIDPVVALRQE